MRYTQITELERYRLADLRADGWPPSAIAARLGRHRTTIWRELRRNRTAGGPYRPYPAECAARRRRRHSRRNRRLTAADWGRVVPLLQRQWSPEQIAGHGRRTGTLRISHETIYRYLAADRRQGGHLCTHLRQAGKQRRRRMGSARRRGERRGRPIEQRPVGIARRARIGHWEVDTVAGTGSGACVVTLVERKTGYVLIGKLADHTAAAFTRRLVALVRGQGGRVRTITADNGSELAGYRTIEAQTAVRFYFARPYHAWERGTNENTNGLLRQYLPKGMNLAELTQQDCQRLARQLNQRPRKRLGYRTPEECYARAA